MKTKSKCNIKHKHIFAVLMIIILATTFSGFAYSENSLLSEIKQMLKNYYDDDLLRTLSLIKQSEIQTSRAFNSIPPNSGIEKYFGTIDDVLKVAEIDTIIYDK